MEDWTQMAERDGYARLVPPTTITVIRHAEKPDKHAEGVTPTGARDEHGLSVRGWTRAGALAALFGHLPSHNHSGLAQPARVIATAPAHGAQSHREVDTATPIAERLGLDVETHYSHADTAQLALSLLDDDRDALIVWHHGTIPALVSDLPISSSTPVPDKWPDDRFDLIWVLTRDGDTYHLSQLEQGLIAGDAIPGRSAS